MEISLKLMRLLANDFSDIERDGNTIVFKILCPCQVGEMVIFLAKEQRLVRFLSLLGAEKIRFVSKQGGQAILPLTAYERWDPGILCRNVPAIDGIEWA